MPYLCEKEWHRWQPRTGWYSGDQMAFHNRTRWTQALILFFACEKTEIKQQKRLRIKIKRRAEQKKHRNNKTMSLYKGGEKLRTNRTNWTDQASICQCFALHLKRKSNSRTFKKSCLMQKPVFKTFLYRNYLHVKKKKKMTLLEENVGKFLTDTSKVGCDYFTIQPSR